VQALSGTETSLLINSKCKIMTSSLEKMNENVAGIDVGSRHFFVGVDSEDGKGEVKNFETYTQGCNELLSHLQQKNIKKVAMEATGSYWKVLYSILTNAGIEVIVVNGRHVKHVPGRKTDVKDCIWIKELHNHGLLRGSFVPDKDVETLRYYMRIREKYIENKSDAARRMDKALIAMNIRISNVISDIQGKSAMAMIKAILDGQHDAEELIKLCDVRIVSKKKEEVLKSLSGFYKPEHLFALQCAYDEYVFYINKMQQCDKKVEEIIISITVDKPEIKTKEQFKRIYHNKPAIKDIDIKVMQLFNGKNLTVLPGITSYTMLRFFAETGSNYSAWPTKKHFAAWLALASSKYQSGKTRKYKKIKCNTMAGQILKEAAQSLLKSKNNALGLWGRQVAARRGPAVAIKAMARKLAVWIYDIVVKGMQFVENGIKQYEEKQKQRNLKWLKKQAAKYNLALVDLDTAQVA
jgi:transposase